MHLDSMTLGTKSSNSIAEELADPLLEASVNERTAISDGPRGYVVSSVRNLEVSATAAEPPWPLPPNAEYREWRRFARYPNYLAAHIVAGLLESEGVPTIVESIGI